MVEQIAQGLASEHGGEKNALRVLVQSHMDLELDYARLRREAIELRAAIKLLKPGVSWGKIRMAHVGKSILPMDPPPPSALDVADPVKEACPNG
jgi:hypothetical protein